MESNRFSRKRRLVMEFVYIIIGFFVILFLFIAVFYITYPYIIKLIKCIYIKWNKVSDEKRKTYTNILVLTFMTIMMLIYIIMSVEKMKSILQP